jgi:glycosyltransferase involved in cell wall biosynthesis
VKGFQVSVIIPVYNAEKFIRQAVESAVFQEAVGEIILIEDGSPDQALHVCKTLAREFKKVKLVQHPNGENKGPGASRNLGLKTACFEYIAFLDADDVYLENRFAITKQIFESAPDVIGVYEAIGVKFYEEIGKAAFCKIRNIPLDKAEEHVTRLKVTNPSDVYKYLIKGSRGFFSTLGLTVKRNAFVDGLYFNESLRLHQDTELWIRLSYHYKFVEGSKVPVSLRGVHASNRISGQNLVSKYKYYTALAHYFKRQRIPYAVKFHLYKSLVRNHPDRKYLQSNSRILKFLELAVIAIKEIKNLPLSV